MIALDEVYDRIKCQRFVPEKALLELTQAVSAFAGPSDQAVVEKWLTYIKNVSRDAMMQRSDKDRDHFAFVHETLCDALFSYLQLATPR
ncbi:MAG TPA: hypothetical protein VEL07_07735 [Planctomycetota bacterium]|nr:hypothetical protein [Planctomycetota bacterium]